MILEVSLVQIFTAEFFPFDSFYFQLLQIDGINFVIYILFLETWSIVCGGKVWPAFCDSIFLKSHEEYDKFHMPLSKFEIIHNMELMFKNRVYENISDVILSRDFGSELEWDVLKMAQTSTRFYQV